MLGSAGAGSCLQYKRKHPANDYGATDVRGSIEVLAAKAQTSELHTDLLYARSKTCGKNNGLVRGLKFGGRPMGRRCWPSRHRGRERFGWKSSRGLRCRWLENDTRRGCNRCRL